MTGPIVVAGATGNLGGRIVRSLIQREATVVALVRPGTSVEKKTDLENLGARVHLVDLTSVTDVARELTGAACLVSAVQGLRDVIVDLQVVLLQAALQAKVPRFIPSDFSTDFNELTAGENRNFDLRREFHQHLDLSPMAFTSVFNGAFAEVLTYNRSLLNLDERTVGYWEDADLPIDFTTMDDTAAYTAAAALDMAAPKALRIASFEITPRQMVEIASATRRTPFTLVRLGSLEELRHRNLEARANDPEGEHEIYPNWQQGQYVQSMFSTHHVSLDNARYSGVTWAPFEDLIRHLS
jgi:NAD(P)-dependent dehydrogenase (short-subunit alcohol dehydrogenase family)